ncbi:hypothetical protein B7463_g7284, partial [Scytalidium lignicola]
MDLISQLESSFVDQLPIEAKLNLEPPEPPADEKEPKPKIKARVNIYTSFEQVLQEFLPLDEVSFDPFSPEEYRRPRTKLSKDFPKAATPLDFFSLYFTRAILQIITRNTNRYANARYHHQKEFPHERDWIPLFLEELYVFLGCVVYMGVHKEPNVELYWSTGTYNPQHILPVHMSLVRFQQIHRFLHISDATGDVLAGRTGLTGISNPNNDIWWYKLEPLASSLRQSFMQYYEPSSTMSVDELMVRCFGRSIHTYKMPSKPISQGYKLFGVADHGYLYNFIWSSKAQSIIEVFWKPELTKTGSLVRELALSLLRHHITIYMDNYFSSIPLFEKLRKCQFRAVGTTRPHAQLPQVFKVLKDKFKKELQWNTLLAKVVDNTLCLAWQDNNIVLALTNIHTVDTTETFRDKVRRRPAKTSTSAWQARAPFGNQPTKELAIPVVIDDYNCYIGGVDIAN